MEMNEASLPDSAALAASSAVGKRSSATVARKLVSRA